MQVEALGLGLQRPRISYRLSKSVGGREGAPAELAPESKLSSVHLF
jgi:hypothetical protein